MTPRLKAIDLFSGSGGLTLGLKRAGFKVIGAVDIDSLSVETYTKNHKSVKIWQQDIRTLCVNEVKKQLNLKSGELDLLAGCPPCQGFSSIRTLNSSRKRITDPRNNLIFEFMRFVKGLRPKVVLLENVPGLAKNWRIKIFSQELKKLGYSSEYKVLDASNFGVPQRRRRMILISSRLGAIPFPSEVSGKIVVRDVIGNLNTAGNSGDALHDLLVDHSAEVLERIKKTPKNGGSRSDLDVEYQLPCHQKCSGFKDVYGRIKWDDVSPTITSGCINPSKGRFIHPEENRSITLREAALLQGFPEDYYFSLKRGKSNAAVLIGNALPPEFVKWHAKEIFHFLRGEVSSAI